MSQLLILYFLRRSSLPAPSLIHLLFHLLVFLCPHPLSFPSVSAEQESLILIKMNLSIETLNSIPFGDCNSPTLPFSSPTNAPSLWFHSFLVSFLLKTSLFWVSSNHLYWWTLFKRGFLLSKRNNRCWWGETGSLVHCRWECKLGQSPCKTVWKFLKKLKKNFEF